METSITKLSNRTSEKWVRPRSNTGMPRRTLNKMKLVKELMGRETARHDMRLQFDLNYLSNSNESSSTSSN